MNKYVALALAGFGGIILITLLLPESVPSENENIAATETTNQDVSQEITTNFPTYHKATISDSSKTIDETGKIFYSLRLETKDAIIDINDWYREALSSGGWNIKSDRNVGGYQIIQSERNNLYTSMQAANGENGTVIISQQAQIRTE